ncbi:hypothetical protein MTO96_029966 [Rhipicephalus appendiculatus]
MLFHRAEKETRWRGPTNPYVEFQPRTFLDRTVLLMKSAKRRSAERNGAPRDRLIYVCRGVPGCGNPPSLVPPPQLALWNHNTLLFLNPLCLSLQCRAASWTSFSLGGQPFLSIPHRFLTTALDFHERNCETAHFRQGEATLWRTLRSLNSRGRRKYGRRNVAWRWLAGQARWKSHGRHSLQTALESLSDVLVRTLLAAEAHELQSNPAAHGLRRSRSGSQHGTADMHPIMVALQGHFNRNVAEDNYSDLEPEPSYVWKGTNSSSVQQTEKQEDGFLSGNQDFYAWSQQGTEEVDDAEPLVVLVQAPKNRPPDKPPPPPPSYHAEGDINSIYSEILLNRICAKYAEDS